MGAYAMSPWNRGGESQVMPTLYPTYDLTSRVLASMGVSEDLRRPGPCVTCTENRDIYFVANRTGGAIKADCRFRVVRGVPRLWDPVTGETQALPGTIGRNQRHQFRWSSRRIRVSLSCLKGMSKAHRRARQRFHMKAARELVGTWQVEFDPKWGGPERVTFDTLQDWTSREESGIKYYSGIATYRKAFVLDREVKGRMYLDLGVIHDMGRVRLNGKDLGVVWCVLWRVEVTGAVKRARTNSRSRLSIDGPIEWSAISSLVMRTLAPLSARRGSLVGRRSRPGDTRSARRIHVVAPVAWPGPVWLLEQSSD